MANLPWPLHAIDIEASSLDEGSYPIEVGVAIWRAPDVPILGWSALIRPTEDWNRHGRWSRASAKVHGIRGDMLRADGQAADQVAAVLNEVLGAATAWCDGGPYDAYWIRRLFAATARRRSFALGDWHGLVRTFAPAEREVALAVLEDGGSQHRARGDAEKLLTTIARIIGVAPPLANLMP